MATGLRKGGRLVGKCIIVTGAAQGIGKASCIACYNEGAHVIATDLNNEKLKELQTELPGIDIDHLDVTDEQQVNQIITKYTASTDPNRNINTVFNCAGWVHHGSAVMTSVTDMNKSFSINVTSMFMISKCVIEYWLKSNIKGSIINMASVASSIKGVPNRCAYSTTKAAVIGLTKSLAADYIQYGIRCNAICPGTVDTPSFRERVVVMGNGDEKKGLEEFTKRQKMGRLATADEIASMVVYLSSDETAFVTGNEMIIDGGWSL